MKKVTLFVAFVACLSMAAVSQTSSKTLSTAQRSLRDNIQSFLKAEGFQPMIDQDGDIKFKRQGSTYFITVSSKDDSPMFIRLLKGFSYNDNLTLTKLTLAATEINRYKMCKLLLNESNYVLVVEMFLTNSTPFTSVFYRFLEIMDSAEREINSL